MASTVETSANTSLPSHLMNPLVLKDYATGRGRNKERGKVVTYERTPETKRLEADIRELNEFVATFDLTGASHDGYTRIFNNHSWKAGGRLYGDGAGNYQQMPEAKRQHDNQRRARCGNRH